MGEVYLKRIQEGRCTPGIETMYRRRFKKSFKIQKGRWFRTSTSKNHSKFKKDVGLGRLPQKNRSKIKEHS